LDKQQHVEHFSLVVGYTENRLVVVGLTAERFLRAKAATAFSAS